MAIPGWLQSYANESDLQKIEEAVQRAETKTSGEIVPMIVSSSSASGHAPIVLSLATLCLLLMVVPLISHYFSFSSLVWDVPVVIVSFVIGFGLARVPALRRATIPWLDQQGAVARRAELEFHATGIPGTAGRTGVLIFISLFERRAVILGDKAISDHVKPEKWVAIVDEMMTKFKSHQFADGMTGAIGHVGEVLVREFPRQADDVDELPNQLIVKD